MSMRIPVDTAYEDLTDDQRYYLDARQWLKDAHATAHQQYLDSPDEDGGSEAQGDSDLTPEEWVKQASKPDLQRELDERGIEYTRSETRDQLGAKLLAATRQS